MWRGEAKVTYTRMDHLEQRVADLEEFVGAISDTLTDTRRELARLASHLEHQLHTCSVCGATESAIQSESRQQRRGWLAALGL